MDPLVKEREADAAAIEWLLALVTAKMERKKRSLGIAIAVVTLLRIEDRIGRGRNMAGRHDHPAAIERLHIALSDVRVDEDAVGFAIIALCRLLEQRQVARPLALQADGNARDLLDDLCVVYQQATRE
jgi:hypothetical protein